MEDAVHGPRGNVWSGAVFSVAGRGPIPEYRQEKIARVHGWLRDTYLYQRTWAGFVGEKWIALVNLWHFFLGIGLSIPLLALPWVLRNRRYWLPVAVVTAVGLRR